MKSSRNGKVTRIVDRAEPFSALKRATRRLTAAAETYRQAAT